MAIMHIYSLQVHRENSHFDNVPILKKNVSHNLKLVVFYQNNAILPQSVNPNPRAIWEV